MPYLKIVYSESGEQFYKQVKWIIKLSVGHQKQVIPPLVKARSNGDILSSDPTDNLLSHAFYSLMFNVWFW